MLTKNECDLIWKIRHGAIPTGRFLYGCKYSHSPNCNYCGELGDLTHISLIRTITPTMDTIIVWRYIIGIPARSGLDVRDLGNRIFAQTKIQLFMVDSTKTTVVCNFVEKWNAYNVLCKLENDNIIFNL